MSSNFRPLTSVSRILSFLTIYVNTPYLREAINAYTAAVAFCETNKIGKQFIYTSHLIIDNMRTELHG